MESLNQLNTSLKNLASSITAKQNERQEYLDKAAEIKEIYERMRDDKKILKEDKKAVNALYKEKYTLFKGNVYKNTYRPEMGNLVDTYTYVINEIDINLDTLNNAVLEYDNKASACLGSLGSLQSAYNTVKIKIQNWTN